MLGIRLDKGLERRLSRLAKKTGRSKSQAIRQYLEDREDYLLGLAVLERKEPTISLEKLERRLGLAR